MKPCTRHHTRRRRGFSLLELAIALAILGLIAGGTMQFVTVFSSEQRLDVTRQRLKAIEEALVRYASRHGRLPCPADASAMTIASAGSEPVMAGFETGNEPGDVQLADNDDDDGETTFEFDASSFDGDSSSVTITVDGENSSGKEKSETKTFDDIDTSDSSSMAEDIADAIENASGNIFGKIEDVDSDDNEITIDSDNNDKLGDGSGEWSVNSIRQDGSGAGSEGRALSVPSGSNPADVDPNWSGSASACSRGDTFVGVPWQQLGIQKSAALDGWNRQITYVVYDGENVATKQDGGNLFDLVDDDNDGSITISEYINSIDDKLDGLGLRVSTDSSSSGPFSHDPSQGNGAAFVLISHGPNGVGAFNREGNPITAGALAFGTGEETNRDHAKDLAKKAADDSSFSAKDLTFIDRARNESDGGDHYDDLVRAMSVQEVARRAGWTPLSGR